MFDITHIEERDHVYPKRQHLKSELSKNDAGHEAWGFLVDQV